jgi:hypothetical protein
VHPADDGGGHELYLLCDDVAAFVAAMRARGVACAEVTDQRWGLLTSVELPGGGTLGVYEPRHARPPQVGEPAVARKTTRKTAAKTRPKAKAKRTPARKAKTTRKKAAARPARAKAKRR